MPTMTSQNNALESNSVSGHSVDAHAFKWVPAADPEDPVSPLKNRERSVAHRPDSTDGYTPTSGSSVAVYWRRVARIILTVVLYVSITQFYRLNRPSTVVYTCSNGSTSTVPRAVNTRYDTIFETIVSESGDKNDAYFCKVKAARAMVYRHPGKRIVYVDEDMVVDVQAVIEDVGCSRLSFFFSPNLREVLQTPFFCFPANEESLEMLEQWWEIKDEYPKFPRGQHDQAAMNDLVFHRGEEKVMKVLSFDPTGIEIGHCSHATGDKVGRAQCKANLAFLVCWDRAIVTLVTIIQFGLWLLPLAVACGVPLIAPGVLGFLFELNPLTILAALGLPRMVRVFLVRNNRSPGILPKMYAQFFSGFIVVSMGDMRRLWVPMVGLATIPQDPVRLGWAVAYVVFFCFLVVYRREVDRWTCVTCPTLYHWLVWSKTAADRCTRLAGTGRWLAVTPSGPNVYHLSCGTTTKCEMGVPASRVHGSPSERLSRASEDEDERLSQRQFPGQPNAAEAATKEVRVSICTT